MSLRAAVKRAAYEAFISQNVMEGVDWDLVADAVLALPALASASERDAADDAGRRGTSDQVCLRDRFTGRLEWETFGSTPFDEVPKSPFYAPSPGSFRSIEAWMEEDGQHVVIAHDCQTTREVHVLPWPTWQQVDDAVSPSFSCDRCGCHGTTQLTRDRLPAVLAAVYDEGSEPTGWHRHQTQGVVRDVDCRCNHGVRNVPAPAEPSGVEWGER